MNTASPSPTMTPKVFSTGPLDQPVKHNRFPSWLLSLVVHFVLFIALALLFRSQPKGAGVESPRSGGIVLVHQTEGETEYLEESDFESDIVSESETTDNVTSSLPTAESPPIETESFLPSGDFSLGESSDTVDVLPGSEGMVNNTPQVSVTGNQATTSVFGVQGTGSTFIYVFDRSASMEGFNRRPLTRSKEELIASLQSLEPHHQFQIVFYNDRPKIFNPFPGQDPRMLFATDENKILAKRFISAIRGEGGTRHMDALRFAVSLSAEVVFFLTDADEPRLTTSQLTEIQKWNRSSASINTIEFGSGPQRSANNFLVKIARQNHGHHVYVDVSKLPTK